MSPTTSLEHLRERITPLRASLLAHPVHGRIVDIGPLRRFMESHVVAVWDFMSLLKSLQRRITCVDVPWTPPADAAACRLVNEIVLGEESDVDEAGQPCGHFDLYRRAMRRAGADTRPIDGLIEDLRGGTPVRIALGRSALPEPARQFALGTFATIEGGDLAAIASAFTFGREDLLPDVFRRIVAAIGDASGASLDTFLYYLDRHIAVDGDDHGPMAERLVTTLCGREPARWQVAEAAAVAALEARLALWDGIAAGL